MISIPGSLSVEACKCDLGFTGTTNCSACTAGSYKAANGSSSCIPCPANAFSPAASASLASCLCVAGFTGYDGGACHACGYGAYKAAILKSTSSSDCMQQLC